MSLSGGAMPSNPLQQYYAITDQGHLHSVAPNLINDGTLSPEQLSQTQLDELVTQQPLLTNVENPELSSAGNGIEDIIYIDPKAHLSSNGTTHQFLYSNADTGNTTIETLETGVEDTVLTGDVRDAAIDAITPGKPDSLQEDYIQAIEADERPDWLKREIAQQKGSSNPERQVGSNDDGSGMMAHRLSQNIAAKI